MIAALDVEGKRARLMHKRCQLAAEHDELALRALNAKAVMLALEADILDLEIKVAEGNPTTSKEELARLHADYDAHYVKALEELEIRKRTRVHDHIVDMVSVSMSSPTFPPSSSPLRQYAHGSPMSDIRMCL